jgi:APA family basic amino acid/polyamine antiporter
MDTIVKATIFSFWAFVGLEGGTSPAEVVHNPRKNIPLAIVLGTGFVSLISVITTISAYCVISPAELENEGAPFSRILLTIFSGYSFDKVIGVITFIMCYGSLNAWVFFSGQIARSAAVEKMFPATFGKLNKKKAPSQALWISAIGTIVLLILQKTSLFQDKIGKFVEMSVVVYIVLYLMCIIAFIKFLWINKSTKFCQICTTALALCFCCFVLYNSEIENFIVLLLMLVSGTPIYLHVRKSANFKDLSI